MYLINGDPRGHIEHDDRGLLYGDGVFETVAVRNGQPLSWDRHMRRLHHGCARLAITAPDIALLHAEALHVAHGAPRAVLKIIITRGPGARGYRAAAHAAPTRVLSVHPWPDYPEAFNHAGVAVRVCATRLGKNPALAGIKHLNRLEQVLARGEWDDPEIAEGLMLDSAGHVIEGTFSNIFAVRDGMLITPDLTACGVAGIRRELILEYAHGAAIPVTIAPLPLSELLDMHEIFLCNSLIGVWPVRELAGKPFAPGPLTRRIAAATEHE